MKIENLLKAGITIASLSLFGGAIAKKPILMYAGANLGISVGVAQLVVKQNEQISKQSTLAKSAIEPDLTAIEATLKKHQKQLKEQCTRQNLTLVAELILALNYVSLRMIISILKKLNIR